jgi:hypothetical protein
MYLHLGQATVVPYSDVIGVFDLDITSQSHITRAFLTRAEREKRVVNVSDELPKAFVLCQPTGRPSATPHRARRRKETAGHCVYISQLASHTLAGRAERNNFE